MIGKTFIIDKLFGIKGKYILINIILFCTFQDFDWLFWVVYGEDVLEIYITGILYF